MLQDGVALHDLEDLGAGLGGQLEVADVERREPGVVLQSADDGHYISEGGKQEGWITIYISRSTHFVFYICLSVRCFVKGKIGTLFCLVHIKRRSFLTSCAF